MFKVGDRVQVDTEKSGFNGALGTVFDYTPRRSHAYGVLLDEEGAVRFSEEELSPAS